jgi:hypothetical protein
MIWREILQHLWGHWLLSLLFADFSLGGKNGLGVGNCGQKACVLHLRALAAPTQQDTNHQLMSSG